MKAFNLSEFFELSDDLMCVTEFDGQLLKYNSSWTKLLGYTPEQLTNFCVSNIIHPLDLAESQKLAEIHKKSSNGHFIYEFRMMDAQGQYHWFSWSSYIKDGKFWGIGKNIEALKNSEDQNTQQKKQFEKIMNNVPGMVYRWELNSAGESRLLYASPYILELLEIEQIKIENDPTATGRFIHPESMPEFTLLVQESAATLKNFHWTGKMLTQNGKTKWVDVRSTPERQDDGSLVWDGVIFDITQQTLARQEMEAARAESFQVSKMAALGEMASGIAHEINNPLAIVHGYADKIFRMAMSNKVETENLLRLSKKILSGTDRIQSIVKSLAKLSYKPSDRILQTVTLNEIVQDVLGVSREKFQSNGITIHLSPNLEKIKLQCAPIEISQMLLNLFNNAYDAVDPLDERWVKLDAKVQDDILELRFTDSGKGIPKDVQTKLFDPFFTSKDVGKGTGLGLSISRRLLERHDGSITLDVKNPNTCFVIKLPLKQKPESKSTL